jgi:hypothetical protein
MSDPRRDPKSKQPGGDLKISLTPAGLFVVAMIVFFFAGGIFAYVQLVTHSFQRNPPPTDGKSKITASHLFFAGRWFSPAGPVWNESAYLVA